MTEGRILRAEMIRRCCGDLEGISAVRSRGDQLLRMPKKEMAESVDCAVSLLIHYAGRLRTQTYSFEEAPERPTTDGS